METGTVERNLFAYADLRVSRREAVPPVMVHHEVVSPPAVVAAPREPEFPYRYIGWFGPERNPIAVFVGENNVVNARVGDPVAGQFRLREIGIDTAVVSAESGAMRRLSLR